MFLKLNILHLCIVFDLLLNALNIMMYVPVHKIYLNVILDKLVFYIKI